MSGSERNHFGRYSKYLYILVQYIYVLFKKDKAGKTLIADAFVLDLTLKNPS